jgi:hypothetical protein
MKKLVALLLVAFVSANVVAQNQPYITKSFSGNNINHIVSETSGGNITVEASTSPRVDVYVNKNGKTKNLSDEEIKSRIEKDYDLRIDVANGTLTATAKPKHSLTNWNNALSISFHIYSPANVSSKLRTSGGNIKLSGLLGNQDFATSGGNLELSNLSGDIKGRTSGGNITVDNCKDQINLATSGGNISGRNSSGEIRLSTSGGSILLNDLNGTINASTSGGNIQGNNVDGELAASTSGGNVSLDKLSCSVKASTSGGNLSVSIQTPGKYVILKNSAGRVHLSIPKNTPMDLNLSALRISTQNLQNFSGSNNKEEIKGKVNGGGIPVTVQSSGGNVDVVFD